MLELVDFERVKPENMYSYVVMHEGEQVIAKIGDIHIKIVTQTLKELGVEGHKYTEEYYLVSNHIWYKAHNALNFAIALNAGLSQAEALYYVEFTSRMLNGEVK